MLELNYLGLINYSTVRPQTLDCQFLQSEDPLPRLRQKLSVPQKDGNGNNASPVFASAGSPPRQTGLFSLQYLWEEIHGIPICPPNGGVMCMVKWNKEDSVMLQELQFQRHATIHHDPHITWMLPSFGITATGLSHHGTIPSGPSSAGLVDGGPVDSRCGPSRTLLGHQGWTNGCLGPGSRKAQVDLGCRRPSRNCPGPGLAGPPRAGQCKAKF